MKYEWLVCEIAGFIIFIDIGNVVFVPVLEASTRDDGNTKRSFQKQENKLHQKYSLFCTWQRKLYAESLQAFSEIILNELRHF